jgi:hypothetical protein
MARVGFMLAIAFFLGGCSTVRGSAVQTGSMRRAPYAGPVAIYNAVPPPPGTELGVVDVRAAESEANVETLVPIFVRRVADLGGNVAVIDSVRATFEFVPRPYAETFLYPCGFNATCVGTRHNVIVDEVIMVHIHGRALSVPAAGSTP